MRLVMSVRLDHTLFRIRSRKFRIPHFLTHFKYVSLVVLAIALPFFTEAHWFSRLSLGHTHRWHPLGRMESD